MQGSFLTVRPFWHRREEFATRIIVCIRVASRPPRARSMPTGRFGQAVVSLNGLPANVASASGASSRPIAEDTWAVSR